MDLQEAADSMRKLSTSLRGAQQWLQDTAGDAAEKGRLVSQARSVAYVKLTEGTAKEREAHVEADIADLKFDHVLAEKMERAAVEKVRNVRQEMSLFQTWLAAYRANAELHRFEEAGP